MEQPTDKQMREAIGSVLDSTGKLLEQNAKNQFEAMCAQKELTESQIGYWKRESRTNLVFGILIGLGLGTMATALFLL